jgi:hypothetical protein
MFPVAVHTGAELSAGVEDVEAEAVAPAPLVEVADSDAPVQPLTASRKVAAATVTANRCRLLVN